MTALLALINLGALAEWPSWVVSPTLGTSLALVSSVAVRLGLDPATIVTAAPYALLAVGLLAFATVRRRQRRTADDDQQASVRSM